MTESGATRDDLPSGCSRSIETSAAGIAGRAIGAAISFGDRLASGSTASGLNRSLETKKLQAPAWLSCQVETRSLPVIRHHAGKSSATEGSVEQIFQKLAPLQRVDMAADLEQEAAAAVEVSSIKPGRRIVGMPATLIALPVVHGMGPRKDRWPRAGPLRN